MNYIDNTVRFVEDTIRFIEDRWLPALESGRYKQADGTLRHLEDGKYSYCCLGVACNLQSNRKGWEGRKVGSVRAIGSNFGWKGSDSGDTSSLLYNANWPMPALTTQELRELASMNDSGISFLDIASHIRSQILPRLYTILDTIPVKYQ